MSSMVQDAYDMGITSTLGGLPTWLEDDSDDFYDDKQAYDIDKDEDEDNYVKPNIEKVRIYEVAKELGITSREVLSAAKEIKIEVKSAQSTITMEQAESLANYIMNRETQTSEENKTNNQPMPSHPKVPIINIIEDEEINDLGMNIDVEIQKRLEIILLSIQLSDVESIKIQTEKLLDISIYIELDSLLYKISNETAAYNTLLDSKSSHMSMIENYLNQQSNNKIYNKKAVIDIYSKLDVLENELDVLEKEKATYIHTIYEFNKQYNLQLGNEIKEILYLKKEIALKSNNDTADIKLKEYNQYLQVLSELTKEKEALSKKGLRIVRKKDNTKISDVITLQKRIKNLEQKIENIKNDIFVVKSDDTYLTVSSIDNIDTYFTNLKKL